jgi:hypothetical protein
MKKSSSSGEPELKYMDDWLDDECRLDNANAKALNTILLQLNLMNLSWFQLAYLLKMLGTNYRLFERISTVRISKLQMLTTQFKELKMGEHETVVFSYKLQDIANQAFQLGKVYSEEKLVWKTLRSLPPQFHPKVTAIEECKLLQFSSTSKEMLNEFIELMQIEFETSIVVDLTFFLDLYIKQMNDGIFISQTKYANKLLKKFNMEGAKSVRTPIRISYKLSKDEKG